MTAAWSTRSREAGLCFSPEGVHTFNIELLKKRKTEVPFDSGASKSRCGRERAGAWLTDFPTHNPTHKS